MVTQAEKDWGWNVEFPLIGRVITKCAFEVQEDSLRTQHF